MKQRSLNQQSYGEKDRALAAGEFGAAAAMAMRTLMQLGKANGTKRFVSVDRAHLASAYDNTRVNQDLAAWLSKHDARVRIPTTLTSCAMDLSAPDPVRDSVQQQLIAVYKEMGCRPVMSCAPYLEDEPQASEVLGWCESSAVVYANSALGAHCLRCPEFVDLCVALTGRAPLIGMLDPDRRRATLRVDVSSLEFGGENDHFILQLLGLWLGIRCGDRVPCLVNFSDALSSDGLRCLGAAAAASGKLDMIHIVGNTPEASTEPEAFQGEAPSKTLIPRMEELASLLPQLERDPGGSVSAVCIGAPHASADELRHVLACLGGRPVAPDVALLLTTNGAVIQALECDGTLMHLQKLGARLVTGRCSYYQPWLPGVLGRVVTPSAKWAWYAHRSLSSAIGFRSMAECIEAAVSGTLRPTAVSRGSMS